MSRCKEIQELLYADYFDREAGPQAKQIVQEHLKACPVCRQLEAKLQAQRLLFQADKPVPVPAHLWGNIRDAIITQRLQERTSPAAGFFERLKGLLLPRPAMVLAASVFSVFLIIAVFANANIQKQAAIRQAAAEGIAGYNLSTKTGYALYDLGTGIEEYFL
jgi:hypothetical protein